MVSSRQGERAATYADAASRRAPRPAMPAAAFELWDVWPGARRVERIAYVIGAALFASGLAPRWSWAR